MVMWLLPRQYREETVCGSEALQQRNREENKSQGENIGVRGEAPAFLARN